MENYGLQEILARHNRRFSRKLSESELADYWPEFAKSLRSIARAYFRDDALVPSLLGSDQGIDPLCTLGAISSFAEFWNTIPGQLEHCLTFEPEQLDVLFFGLAEPPRFGTAPGRYPNQIDAVRKILLKEKIIHPAILDVGCGTGLGTLELADATNAGKCLGITPEPLEILMAQKRFLPHDQQREMLYAQYKNVKADFRLGSAEDFALHDCEKFHFIFCNGLIGGPIFHQEAKMELFIANCRRHLLPDGYICCANNFHDGHRPNVEKLLNMLGPFEDWKNAYFQITP